MCLLSTKGRSFVFSVKNIVTLALMLALLIASKFIAYPIPSLPNGLGNIFVMFEILIILFSFTLGFTRTIIVGAIFYGIIVWIGLPFFMAEILSVKDPLSFAGVYFLDYVIPFICYASSGVIYRKFPSYYVAIINVTVAVICAYLSSVTSGVIFWGAYAWKGWSVVAYSFAANGIRYGSLLFTADMFIIAIIDRLKIVIKEKVGENYARY